MSFVDGECFLKGYCHIEMGMSYASVFEEELEKFIVLLLFLKIMVRLGMNEIKDWGFLT